jgi:hypothetical protein
MMYGRRQARCSTTSNSRCWKSRSRSPSPARSRPCQPRAPACRCGSG